MNIIDSIWNKLMFSRKRVHIGKNVKVHGRVHLHGARGNIYIGDNCVITSSSDYNPTAGGPYTHLVTGPNGILRIGNNVGMSLVNITAQQLITIEDDVLIGAGAKIWDTDFHSTNYVDRKNGHDIPCTAPVLIGEGAFIGSSSIILKGVTIGKHAVIGAGSVVTKNVPENEIWAGNPAKRCGEVKSG